ncbi:MAG: thiolase family protein [Saprospiraceae bacterium]
MLNEVYIVSTKRTPFGSFGGILTPLKAVDLGAHAIRNTIDDVGIDKNLVEEVIFGNVYSANIGQAPARQAAILAGLPYHTSCTTVNKVCASGMKALMLGAQSIALGHRDLIMVGGMESMSNVPYYLPKLRWGNKYGNIETIDGLQKDGLQDAYDHCAMGVSADETARRYTISRSEQDEYAIRSYKLSAKAWEENAFKNEVVPINIELAPGKNNLVEKDEEYSKVNFDKIPQLKPSFSKDGTVTAANASTINDGSAALLLASGSKIKELNLSPLARIVSYADAEQEPKWFTTTPTIAAPLALSKAGLSLKDIDFFEVNEAFSVVALAFAKVLEIDLNKLNIRGGAVSLGHPLGASGARIIGALVNILISEGGRYGLAAICNGGGGASAVIIEKC